MSGIESNPRDRPSSSSQEGFVPRGLWASDRVASDSGVGGNAAVARYVAVPSAPGFVDFGKESLQATPSLLLLSDWSSV